MKRARSLTVAAALLAGACGGSPTPTPSSTPSPAPPTVITAYNVENCFTQAIPGTRGLTLRTMVVPDTVKLDLTLPSGFPNGRDLDDPVADILVAILFLDFTVTGQSTATFANLPVNPPANDRPFSQTFPFLAPPQGTPPIAATTGTAFNFRTDPDSAYVSVDRMGIPAAALTLIAASSQKLPYNDANPTVDARGQFRAEETASLTALFNGIGDDLQALGLKVCARQA